MEALLGRPRRSGGGCGRCHRTAGEGNQRCKPMERSAPMRLPRRSRPGSACRS